MPINIHWIEYFQKVIPDTLGTSLEQHKELKIIRWPELEKSLKIKNKFPANLFYIGHDKKPEIVIYGEYTKTGNHLHVLCKVLSIKQRGTIYKLKFSTPIDQSMFMRMDQVAQYLMKKLQENRLYQ